MARFLQDLLGAQEPQFSTALHHLERATGQAGVDVRLIGDIIARAHEVMRRLKLDPADTTAEELYGTLNAHLQDSGLFEATAWVGLSLNGEVISFNQADIEANRLAPFAERTVQAMRDALEQELVDRYHAHPRTDSAVVAAFARDAGLVHTEKHDPSTQTETPTPMHDTPYILCVGDIITDAFIKLDEQYAQSYKDDKGYQRLSFELGAKLPYDSVEIVQAVECSPNAAVSITRLGLQASLMSWIGDDGPGKDMVKYLGEQGVGTSDVVVEAGMKSNYHYVLRYGADRTKLQKFEDYAYEWKTPSRTPDWLYLGVLGEKTWPLHEAMLQYLTDNPAIKLVFQPGMYHLMWGTEKMAPFYKRAEIVIMNREEAAQVTGKDRGDVSVLLDALHGLGVSVAVVTDGADGAYASDGNKKLFMPNYPDPQPPLDRTGAGDAFASTIAAALALGQPLETALEWAPINSMSVVQQMGAQAGLLHRNEINRYLHTAPRDYRAREIQ